MTSTHKENKGNKTVNKIAYSPRSKVRLTREEMDFLRKYLDYDVCAYAVIQKNTAVSRATILRLLDRGWMQLGTAVRLRPFLKDLESSTEFSHLK